MWTLLKTLHKDHDIIIISDSNTFHATQLLKHFGLYQYVSAVFSRPLTLKENGQLVASDLKPAWKAPCQYGGRNICKGQVLIENTFFGDGTNDFCPSMTLSRNSLVIPRKVFFLPKIRCLKKSLEDSTQALIFTANCSFAKLFISNLSSQVGTHQNCHRNVQMLLDSGGNELDTSSR